MVMASGTFSPVIFYQEPGLSRAPKEFQSLFPGHGKRQDIPRSGSMLYSAHHLEDPRQPIRLSSEYDRQCRPAPMIEKPVLIDVQDADGRPDSVHFSFGIVEQCARREKILKYLMSGSRVGDGKCINISLLSDLMGFRAMAIGMLPQMHIRIEDEVCLYDVGMDEPHRFIHPQSQLYAPKPLLNFVGDFAHTSTISLHPDGRVLLTGSGTEMKDLLSIDAEFNLSKKFASSKQSVIPYFTRSDGGHARASTRGLAQTVASPKSPKNGMLKQVPKQQQNRKLGREKDLYRKNYLHACESLLSVILDKKRDGGMAILTLKRSGPEMTDLLSQFSAGIAGTGLAVLFSVAFKVASGRLPPFSAAKLLNAGFGFGLFWLSGAISGLRDAIVCIRKNASRVKPEEEVVRAAEKIDKSVNDVLFRAVALMAVAILRFV